MGKSYIAIDLKSFYASVECVERELNPLEANLVVADASRTEKTICLAVSPSLKSFGIPGRPRLFEVTQKIKQINQNRFNEAKACRGKSIYIKELQDKRLAIDYIVAKPRMALYMDYSNRIYQTYLKYIAPEDIHVYSIDEVFIDATNYLTTYNLSASELAMRIIQDVLANTGITATAGIGTNLFLAKIAMDIEAKHMQADENGVRMAILDEISYRKKLWRHQPITDFWNVGAGYAKRLQKLGLKCMGDIARLSLSPDGENALFKEFGINAELLIDHAWGHEPCTISYIKNFKTSNHSLSQGQVLSCAYSFEKALLVIKEMADGLSLDLVKKHLVCDQIVITVGYDIDNLKTKEQALAFNGDICLDHYGRLVPKPAHGSINLKRYTSSTQYIVKATEHLFKQIVDQRLLVRRMYVVANHVINEIDCQNLKVEAVQLDLFTDYEALKEKQLQEELKLDKEKKRQKAILALQKKFGKNAVLKASSLEEGATAISRNQQIGGHRA